MTPYPGDLRAYVLAALPYAGAEALRIAAWCLAVTIPAAAACWLLATASRLARRRARRERDLPALARAIGRVERTRAMPLGDLVISPEQERYAAYKAAAPTEVITRCGFCHDISQVGDWRDCRCPRPCGASWCTAARRAGRGTA